MKRILFPTDFSLNSIHAIRYGIELHQGQDVEYLLFNCYTDPSIGANMTYVFEEHMKKVSESMLEKTYELLREDNPTLQMELLTQYGELPEALTPLIEERSVDLIIMGSSGATGPSLSFIGSKAFSTIKKAPCPVLTVPLQAPIERPRQIGIASDQVLRKENPVLSPLMEIAIESEACVSGLHVQSQGQNRPIEGSDIPFVELEANGAAEGIALAIGEHQIDLLGLIIKKRGLLEELFHKSVSKKVAAQVSVPILALHEN